MQFYKKNFTSELSLGNKIGRVLWGVAYLLLFRPSPRIAFSWRRFILTLFRAELAVNVRIYPDVKIYAPWNLTMKDGSVMGDGVNCYNVGKVIFEEESNVTHYTFICTASHDIDSPGRDLRVAPVSFGIGSWVFGHAIILPGVVVGRGSIVAAGSVVTKDVSNYHVVGGNPARKIKERLKVDELEYSM